MAPSGDVRRAAPRETGGTPTRKDPAMNTTAMPAVPTGASAGVAAFPALPPATPRLDLYTPIHKALRAFMADTLQRVGALDVDDDQACNAVLQQTEQLLDELRGHVGRENLFVHAALEARRPGSSVRIAGEHVAHLEQIRNLEDAVQALHDALPAQRAAFALSLYRQLAEFVADNLLHMACEEREHNSALWALYSDAELEAMHDRLIASLTPAELALTLRWLAVGLNPQELAALFKGLQAKAPPEAVRALLDIVQAQLPTPRWAKLARALGLAPVPGLVET
jgi:hypothetical protein